MTNSENGASIGKLNLPFYVETALKFCYLRKKRATGRVRVMLGLHLNMF